MRRWPVSRRLLVVAVVTSAAVSGVATDVALARAGPPALPRAIASEPAQHLDVYLTGADVRAPHSAGARRSAPQAVSSHRTRTLAASTGPHLVGPAAHPSSLNPTDPRPTVPPAAPASQSATRTRLVAPGHVAAHATSPQGRETAVAPSSSGTAGAKTPQAVAAAPYVSRAPQVTGGVAVLAATAAAAALALDAPDPDVVLADTTYYAFTTGTTWGNQLGIAADTSGDPTTGWRPLGSAFADDGHASPAAWGRKDTSTSPGVIYMGNRWILFYDIFDETNGYFCLSEAIASSATGPYVDSSRGPLECQPNLGGSIDPQPFLDPNTGVAYLMWKNNAGLCQGDPFGYCGPGQRPSTEPSHVWSAPLTADGLGLAAAPRAIFEIQSAGYPWQTTTDDPSMVFAGGHYYLFFSGGDWLSNYYPVGYVLCSGPLGRCDQTEAQDPILSGTGGTGGGMEFTDLQGRWWIVYQSWLPAGCTNYSTGCERELFITPLSLPPITPPARTPVRILYR